MVVIFVIVIIIVDSVFAFNARVQLALSLSLSLCLSLSLSLTHYRGHRTNRRKAVLVAALLDISRRRDEGGGDTEDAR